MIYRPKPKIVNEYEWHEWFTWKPVKTVEGFTAWLAWIQRKKEEVKALNCKVSSIWIYRTSGPTTPEPAD